jgi:aminopeptidase N
MLATLLGREGFRRGMDLYFDRHDGSAVTVEDFLAALGDANALDLGCWLGWYRQAGTPVLEVRGRYDAEQRCLELSLRQHTTATPGQNEKQPLPIPVALALFDARGNRLPLQCEERDRLRGDVLLLEQAEATFHFANLDSEPVVSLLRGYSAPVRLVSSFDARSFAILASHETDGFNRWQAADAMARQAFSQLLAGERDAQPVLEAWIGSLRTSLSERAIEPATLAEMLTVADPAALAEPLAEIDPDAVFEARLTLETTMARALELQLLERYAALAPASAEGTQPAAQARRRLRNRCQQLLCVADRRHHTLAATHYAEARCLSDRLGALTCIVHSAGSAAAALLEEFAAAYRDDPNVMDKWFAVQATVPSAAALGRVRELTRHPAFRWDNPNKVYALLLGLAHRNPIAFHRLDGAGYRYTAEAIRKLDAINPQVAARLATAFGAWQRLEPRRREAMRGEMRRLRSAGNLSADVADILGRSLGEA